MEGQIETKLDMEWKLGACMDLFGLDGIGILMGFAEVGRYLLGSPDIS